jgi:hypothetical protein
MCAEGARFGGPLLVVGGAERPDFGYGLSDIRGPISVIADGSPTLTSALCGGPICSRYTRQTRARDEEDGTCSNTWSGGWSTG